MPAATWALRRNPAVGRGNIKPPATAKRRTGRACYDAAAISNGFRFSKRAPDSQGKPSQAENRRTRGQRPERSRTASRGVISRRGSARRRPGSRSAAISSGRGSSAAAQGRVLGANDRVVVASIGIRGQGNSLKRGFAQLKNVEIKTLCDIDANLAPSASTTRGLQERRHLQARTSCRTCGACSTTRTSTPSSSRRRTTGTRSRRSGRCRPASTSTSRSRRRTPCGKAARWSRPRRATTRSCRSAR